MSLSGKDLIALAQTGRGKTGDFALPILQALIDSPQKAFFALDLSPTKEIAVQIRDHFDALGKDIGAKSTSLIGGLNMGQESRVLATRPHVIHCTWAVVPFNNSNVISRRTHNLPTRIVVLIVSNILQNSPTPPPASGDDSGDPSESPIFPGLQLQIRD
ncbi:uncharacterized protein LOC133726351 isoform X2 [Rosa rugosa]|uniref:uncharacterized protein LOC133726351 isoform X2 n=1 Tax=Rosa rugosa TaxID=74645 RepID=UPI002B412636|nr:uncharacterized protein LOC133726351 isoform X2 [Rosa rugosa]